MSTKYKVVIKNRSSMNGKMCIFQKLPDQHLSNIFSLAWFSKQCNANTTLTFEWAVKYSANWAETGILKPGISFQAGQSEDADPSDKKKNSFGLTLIDGGYQFVPAAKQAEAGTIGIFADGNIPNSQASIGIGMNGEPAFATQALMNYNFIFEPKVRYYLVFGNYQQGVVMDLTASTDAFEIAFPKNVFEREIELGDDNMFRYTK